LLYYFQAHVVCFELGFNCGAESAFGSSYFGLVPEDFSYNVVTCAGTENSMDECPHNNNENCGPTEGAGVICNTTYVAGINTLFIVIVHEIFILKMYVLILISLQRINP
jgi:hypothetical protein